MCALACVYTCVRVCTCVCLCVGVRVGVRVRMHSRGARIRTDNSGYGFCGSVRVSTKQKKRCFNYFTCRTFFVFVNRDDVFCGRSQTGGRK